MKKILLGLFMLFAVSVVSFSFNPSPDWVYNDGEWIWDGSANYVTVIGENANYVWYYDYDTGEYEYLGSY